MNSFKDMLQAHPRHLMAKVPAYFEAVEACYDCARSCVVCADACVGEEQVAPLRRCIRVNQDCADTCFTTANLLVRQTEPDWRLLREQLRLSMTMANRCAEECKRHAIQHAHCRICNDACVRWVLACNKFLETLPG